MSEFIVQVVTSVAVAQARLDEAHKADVTESVRVLRQIEPSAAAFAVARVLLPSRLFLDRTSIEIDANASRRSSTGFALGLSPVSLGFTRK